MVSDEQRLQIRAEEVFRQEVRHALEQQKAPPSARTKAWAILNSSFVLWLLSSVLVSGLTAAYARYQDARAARAQQQDLVRRLDTEIGNRIYHTRVGLEVDRDNVERGAYELTVRDVYARLGGYLNNTAEGGNQDYSVFPEHRSRNFPSLLIELTSLVAADELGEVAAALAAYQQIAKTSSDYTLDSLAAREDQLKAIAAAAVLLAEGIERPRWRIAAYPAVPN